MSRAILVREARPPVTLTHRTLTMALSANVEWTRRIAWAIVRATQLAGFSIKQLAGEVGISEAEVSKWIRAERRPQLDRLFAVDRFRPWLIVAFSELDERFEVATIIQVKPTPPERAA